MPSPSQRGPGRSGVTPGGLGLRLAVWDWLWWGRGRSVRGVLVVYGQAHRGLGGLQQESRFRGGGSAPQTPPPASHMRPSSLRVPFIAGAGSRLDRSLLFLFCCLLWVSFGLIFSFLKVEAEVLDLRPFFFSDVGV